MPVKTKRVRDRRKLRFDTVEALLADAECVAVAERAGTLRTTGNWTPGQIFGHVAKWIAYMFDGYPFQPPWFVRVAGPLIKKRILTRGMPAGQRLPIPQSKLGDDPSYSLDEGLARLREQARRILNGDATPPRNPVFGSMTRDEWIRLHLRHAELHFSFLHS